MSEFVPVLSLEELPEHGVIAVDVQGRSILVGRIQNHLIAWIDRCPHAGAPLRIGKLRGEELTCAWHGWTFNLITGESVPNHSAFCLTRVPIKVDGVQVLIEV
jgi:nitrite reductase (NADH) small subunit